MALERFDEAQSCFEAAKLYEKDRIDRTGWLASVKEFSTELKSKLAKELPEDLTIVDQLEWNKILHQCFTENLTHGNKTEANNLLELSKEKAKPSYTAMLTELERQEENCHHEFTR